MNSSPCRICGTPGYVRTIDRSLYIRCDKHFDEIMCTCHRHVASREIVLQDGKTYRLCDRCTIDAAGLAGIAMKRVLPEDVRHALDLIAEQIRTGEMPDVRDLGGAMLASALSKRKGGAG